ncbi:hypothetical protein D1871_10440 [Nakamurella silvestris]|nr:hypothetical protein D1871_10440 [Nakamurella silvestris]
MSLTVSAALAIGGLVVPVATAQAGGPTGSATPAAFAKAAAPAEFAFGAPSAVAATYYEVLLRHTVWAETQWDPAKGYYKLADFSFGVVLGNALLLTRGQYDAALAGVDKETLRAHTIATIDHFAASNRLAGGTEWGKQLFWDSTTESYFALAAHLLWDQLSPTTKANVDAITTGQAAYTTSLGSGNDPMSGSWTPNGLTGGFKDDTKLEEMGVYAQAISPGLAWNPQTAGSDQWEKWLGIWSRNEAGLPAADKANPAVVGGVPVSDNTAKNIYDTFAVENHSSFGPHYQVEMWRTAGRNSIHFLMAGRDVPEPVTQTPNADQMWATIMSVMSDSGEPLMPMVADRQHLYGRDVIPIAYLAQVQGDRYAARAEQNMADRLLPYQAYGAAPRLAKFSGEPKYEPETRAEISISYLFHELRAAKDGAVIAPVTNEQFFAKASRTTDYGAGQPGLLAQQSPSAWAGTVDRAGMVKYAWQPQHDDWLFDIGGAATVLLPSVTQTVSKRSAVAYSNAADGFDGTASLLTTSGGRSGMTTLPTGSIVYATSGTAAGEGTIRTRNFRMPGMPGLDGTRDYTTAEGSTPITKPAPSDAPVITPPAGVSRVDTVTFEPTTARYVRMQGVQGNATYGYSLFSFEVRNGSAGADLANGKTGTASSEDVSDSRQVTKAFDGNMTTRWAVAKTERARTDSWIQVDLGAPTTVDRAVLYWESAAGQLFDVQVSTDGTTWTTVSSQAPGFAKVDNLTFPQVDARYVRMQGVVGEPTYGYSLWEFEVRKGSAGANLARQAAVTATASSGTAAASVKDGNYATRWSVATDQRTRQDSWIQLDLGAVTSFDQVRLFWESATASALKIQVSTNGTTWTEVASRGLDTMVNSAGNWLGVDDRAGFVVRNSTNPITVIPGTDFDQIVLSNGPAAGASNMVVEGYAGASAAKTKAAAARTAPVVDIPTVAASDADGYLSLFELSGTDAQANVLLARSGADKLYQGTQRTTASGTEVAVSLAAATSQVRPPRFTVTGPAGEALAPGWSFVVTNAQQLTVEAPAGIAGQVRLAQIGSGTSRTVAVAAGGTAQVTFDSGRPYPLLDLAVGRTTFPTSPLPVGMIAPAQAVDDNACTAWTPGVNGRLVVDLGKAVDIGSVYLAWAPGTVPSAELQASTDGLTYTSLGVVAAGRTSSNPVTARVRYLAVATNSTASTAGLREISVGAAGADANLLMREHISCAADIKPSTVAVTGPGSFPVQPQVTSVPVKVVSDSGDLTGPVTVIEKGVVIGSGTVGADGSGVVDLTVPLGVGDHRLTAKYAGNDSTAASTSAVKTLQIQFTDKSGGEFLDDIQWLATAGITQGFTDGSFHPGASLDRAAVAAWLYRLTHNGATAPACTAAPASDVPLGRQFCGEISWMYQSGLTTGYPDGTFRPAGTVERQQVAVFLYRLAKGKPGTSCSGSSPFPDVPASSGFCEAITWAAANQITTGFTDGRFQPVASAQRQAVAAFFHRYANLG